MDRRSVTKEWTDRNGFCTWSKAVFTAHCLLERIRVKSFGRITEKFWTSNDDLAEDKMLRSVGFKERPLQMRQTRSWFENRSVKTCSSEDYKDIFHESPVHTKKTLTISWDTLTMKGGWYFDEVERLGISLSGWTKCKVYAVLENFIGHVALVCTSPACKSEAVCC